MDRETRDMMMESAGKLLAELSTREAINEAEKGTWPKPLWDAAHEAGLMLIAVPEASGGVGGSVGDMAALAKLCGYHAAPAPIVETALAGHLLAAAGIDIPEGPLALAVPRPGDAGLIDGGGKLGGEAHGVAWGAKAAGIVACGAGKIALLTPGQYSVDARLGSAGEPRDKIVAKNGSVIVKACSLDPWRLGAVMRTAQIAGAAQRTLDIAAVYARERKQFGKAIASFQAVQQLLAELAGQVAGTVAAAEMAANAEEKGRDQLALAAAKARASEAAGRIAAMSHQTLGAMGFTYEHNLHHFTRRLWVWRDEFGSDTWWARRLGRAIANAGAAKLWTALTDGASLGPV